MKFTIITLFPSVINEYISTSIISKAQAKNLVQIEVIDLRHFGKGSRRNVDDTVYGGGDGMVITVPVLDEALGSIEGIEDAHIIYLSPKGKVLNQQMSQSYLKHEHIVLIAGHYEGIDERIFSLYNIHEVSIGDYVLTGGELPALTLLDSITRLIPGVIKEGSKSNESLDNFLLEEPQYTKPEEYKGLKVPEILLSGNHGKIAEYRHEEKLYQTLNKRPDLFKRYINENKLDINKINEIITKKEGN
ncbi:MAG: tRNA (guanosine(37)-N1)-methyltransferase TrmD [Clostridia bacterium]|nr:tRNA (guanosine(37)-N1)-methyltransferase TrmD [Clostridia bacterium]